MPASAHVTSIPSAWVRSGRVLRHRRQIIAGHDGDDLHVLRRYLPGDLNLSPTLWPISACAMPAWYEMMFFSGALSHAPRIE